MDPQLKLRLRSRDLPRFSTLGIRHLRDGARRPDVTDGNDRSLDLFEPIHRGDPGWNRPRRWIGIGVVAVVAISAVLFREQLLTVLF
jgi:hypothetical protein